VSLPAGVFNPYSGVKTSILFLDRNLARRMDEVLFVKIENDGFDLGAQRRPIEGSQLAGAIKIIADFGLRILDLKNEDSTNQQSKINNPKYLSVSRARLLQSPDINLSGDRYRVAAVRHTGKWPMVKLGEVCELYQPKTITGTDIKETGSFKVFGANGVIGYFDKYNHEEPEIAVTCRGATCGTVNMTEPRSWITGNSMVVKPKIDGISKLFLYHLLKHSDLSSTISGSAQPQITRQSLAPFEIPLPPIDEQERIVAELEGYRKVIEGARQILANYKPTIRIDPAWPTRELGKISNIFSGGTPSKAKIEYWNGNIPWVSPKDMKVDRITNTIDHISKKAVADSAVNLVPEGAVLCVVRSGILAHTFPVAIADVRLTFNQDINGIVVDKEYIIPEWLFYVFCSFEADILARGIKRGGTVHSLQNDFLRERPIPLPPLSVQREIVAELEKERKLVNANRDLIARMEARIRTKLAEVWGETGDV